MHVHDRLCLTMNDLPDRKTVGFLRTANGRRLMLVVLLLAMVMQVFEGRFIVWDVAADWRPIVAAILVAIYSAIELRATFAHRRALATTIDATRARLAATL